MSSSKSVDGRDGRDGSGGGKSVSQHKSPSIVIAKLPTLGIMINGLQLKTGNKFVNNKFVLAHVTGAEPLYKPADNSIEAGLVLFFEHANNVKDADITQLLTELADGYVEEKIIRLRHNNGSTAKFIYQLDDDVSNWQIATDNGVMLAIGLLCHIDDSNDGGVAAAVAGLKL